MAFSIPDRIEVTIRICLSLILVYTLTLGSFPNVIPPSTLVIVASVTSAFTMVLPTLLFSIGAAVFPGMVMTTCVALIVSTILLAVAATAGVEAYIAVYFIFALILAGLRFTKEGASSAMLLMFTALNTMSLSSIAEEQGLGFVASLWTESGMTNPNAVFRNTLIGLCWCSACIAFARLIPPSRTARSVFSRKLLPRVLHDVAGFIRMTLAYHIKDDDDYDDDNDQDEINNNATESSLDGNEGVDRKPESMEDVILRIVQDGSITFTGGVASLTALEPRITRFFCRCSPPSDLVTLLNDLTNAVNGTIFGSLTLRAFSKAGFKELEIFELKEVYEESAARLDQCAEALATLKHLPSAAVKSNLNNENPSPLPFDPIRLTKGALRVEELTNDWIDAMGPIDRTKMHFGKSARKIYIGALKPWIMGAGFGLVVAILQSISEAFIPLTWKRIVYPPYYDLPKCFWCLKFAIGFTALICMQVYYPAFANLEIPTSDEILSPHFSGWSLIAYAFSTTQTVEGTWKKGILRILGTVSGAFSAWLALTACSNNPYGLGAWMTITNTLVAFFGLPMGFSSRFGLDPDLAWGPAYFSMTQALVVMEVYLGYGGKNDITVNRIVANLVGKFQSFSSWENYI